MQAWIENSDFEELEFRAPPSKSYTHRAYAVACLGKGISHIKDPLVAEDTLSTLKACEAFGAEVTINKNMVSIDGTGGVLKTPKYPVDVGNSGTTLRFFTSIAALDGRVLLTGDESIRKRPMGPLLDALSQWGVRAESVRGNHSAPLEVFGGGIPGGGCWIKGDISSQFISSLLIVAPYAKEPVSIKVTTPLKSRPYVDLTLDIMNHFGARVHEENNSFHVQKGLYKGRRYTVEGDFSSASYLLALGALCRGKVVITNLSGRSSQGDRIILDILKRMGGKIKVKEDKVILEGGDLRAIEVDLGDTPDLLPTVAALASAAKGTTRITNIAHARLKESDRVRASAVEFRKFGATIKEGSDYLEITGTQDLVGAKVNSYNDHRMAMALTVLGASSKGVTIINDAECVAISYPDFYTQLAESGIKVTLK